MATAAIFNLEDMILQIVGAKAAPRVTLGDVDIVVECTTLAALGLFDGDEYDFSMISPWVSTGGSLSFCRLCTAAFRNYVYIWRSLEDPSRFGWFVM